MQQALPDQSGRDHRHLIPSVQVTQIVLPRELPHIPLKVFRAELVKRTLMRPLQRRPEGLNAVGVGLVPDYSPTECFTDSCLRAMPS